MTMMGYVICHVVVLGSNFWHLHAGVVYYVRLSVIIAFITVTLC
jgi:hypothetical protein